MDTFITAITLGVLGWFLATCRSLSFEKKAVWTCCGFIGGLLVDTFWRLSRGAGAQLAAAEKKIDKHAAPTAEKKED